MVMADSKCANSEYALDVDLMMIDYVVYKGIEAHIQALESISAYFTQTQHDRSWDSQEEENATRLVEIFDLLLHLFRLNHDNTQLSERIQFSIKILQFLTLIVYWCKSKGSGFVAQDCISKSMAEQLSIDQIVNRAYRREWLRLHRQQRDGANLMLPGIAMVYEHSISMGDNLMIRFLELSEEMASVIDSGQLSDKWVKLANEFMFQSALERFSEFSNLEHEVRGAFEEDMMECCAWGYQEHEPYAGNVQTILESAKRIGLLVDERTRAAIEARAELEDRIAATMFCEDDSDDANAMETRSSQEPRTWMAARDHFEHELLMTLSSMAEAESHQVRVPVKILEENHPIDQFVEDLKTFIENQWKLVSRRDWYGKPVLIQIEEGYIDGLSSEEFDAFKQRVGI